MNRKARMAQDLKAEHGLGQKTEQQLRAEREQECAKQINALLAQFACRFQTMVVIVDGQIETRVNVVAL